MGRRAHRLSPKGRLIVSTGLAEVVRRRGGFMVGAKVVVGTTLGFRVVRTTKCEFLWVV